MPMQMVLTSGLDELHRVVDRQARAHRPARRIDVQRDVLFGILGLEEQQLGDDDVGHVVLDRTHGEHHTLLEKARIDVVRAFATRGLLHDNRHQIQRAFVHRLLLITSGVGLTELGELGKSRGLVGHLRLAQHPFDGLGLENLRLDLTHHVCILQVSASHFFRV